MRPALQDSTAAIRALRDAFRPRTGGTVIIRGPAGMGKSRLVDTAERLARDQGRNVLRCQGVQGGRELALASAETLLERNVRLGDSANLDDLHARLHELAAERPLALLADEAHWLDARTLRFLACVARRAPAAGIVLVVAMRWHEPGAETTFFESLATAPAVTLIEPPALGRAAVCSLLEERLQTAVDDDVAAAARRATAGIPLLVCELAATLTETPTVEAVDGAAPEPIAWWLVTVLRAFGPQAEPVARAIAVLGEAPFDVVAGLAGGAARPVVEALQRAAVLADDSTIRFRAPIAGRALLAALPAAQRARLHRRAAEQFAKRGDDPRTAHHLLASDPTGSTWAAEALVRSADAALSDAEPGRAVALARRALDELPADPARALAMLARAQSAAGDADAAGTFEDAILATDDPDEKAGLLLRLAWEQQTRGRFARAALAARRGLELDAGGADRRVELQAMRDAAELWSPGTSRPGPPPDPADGGRHAERVALADLARREMFAGRDHRAAAEAALRAWDHGAFLNDATSDDPAAIRIMAALQGADFLPDALAVAEACLADARERNSAMAQVTWRHLRGHVHAFAGRLPDAERDLRVGFASRSAGWGAWVPVNAGALAAVLIERGDLDGAAEIMRAARADDAHPAISPMWAVMMNAEGRLALARGRHAEALEILTTADARARAELGTVNPSLGTWRHDTVRALHALGRTDEAVEHAERLLEDARAWGAPPTLGTALLVRGEIAPAAEATPWLQQAVDVLSSSEARLDHAYALVTLAAGTGDRDGLRAGLDLAERYGSRTLALRARAQLVALGARPRRNRLSGPEALTRREHEIAELAAAGRTNAAIADELFVTPKTVAFHLSNVYRKLSVDGRDELAAALHAA